MDCTSHFPQAGAASRKEYLRRINRVIDYIEHHLAEPLSLEVLAQVACFSPFHFHRLFKAMTGETLNRFIQRLRLEKAASQLYFNPEKPITDIALDCGFSGSAAFARAFKESFQMSATAWRTACKDPKSKIGKTYRKTHQVMGKMWQESGVHNRYVISIINPNQWRIHMINNRYVNIEVKNVPELEVIYVRHIGPYKGNSGLFEQMFNRLMQWAGPRGLLRFPETQVLAVYHDDPNLTAEEKLRTSACLTVPQETAAEGDIGRMTIPGGSFAIARFELENPAEYEMAWTMLFSSWLPESGYQCDSRLYYEVYQNNPKEHPQGIHIIDICIPVKPL